MAEVIEKAKETVEVAAPEVVAPALPTVEEVKGKGWTAPEIEAAQKRGMVQKPEEKKPEEKAVSTEKVEDKPSDVDVLVKNGVDLTADQEREFLKKHPAGTPDSAFYHRAKNERHTRQRAQKELEAERAGRAADKAAFEARLSALEKGKVEPEVDADGNPVDPADKPLTEKRLKEIEKAREEEFQKQRREQGERAAVVLEAQKTQEDIARGRYTDFDDTVKRAAEVMQNIDTLIPEKWKQTKVAKLVRDLQVAAANADQFDPEGFTAADIAYEIGQLHPDYGKSNGDKPKETVKTDPKANGGLTPEQMKRIEDNNRRGASSASIPGGGAKRTIDVEDVGLAELNAMSFVERQKFRDKHPERYAKLLR